MVELQPAYYTAGACHTAQGDRLVWSSIICEEGVSQRSTGDLLVTKAADGLVVNVAAGSAFIQGDDIADQGMYHVFNTGPVPLTLGASDPTDARVDLIVARVRDAQYVGAENDWLLMVVPGVPSPAPAPPALPPDSIPLAQVTVAAGSSTPAGMTLVDVRPQAQICADSIPLSDNFEQSGTVSGQMSNSVLVIDVAFPEPFAAPPAVTASAQNSFAYCAIGTPTTTGVRLYMRDTRSSINGDFSICWIARGTRA